MKVINWKNETKSKESKKQGKIMNINCSHLNFLCSKECLYIIDKRKKSMYIFIRTTAVFEVTKLLLIINL
jgi:hypothetical protein